jgi:Ca2+-binding RTX toxin-like protein
VTAAGTLGASITGNALDNLLTGNAGVNILNGGAGNDTLDGGLGADNLQGGAGDDYYVVNLVKDIVNETLVGSSGTDTVEVALGLAGTYVMTANVENAFVNSAFVVNVTGNAINNQITGNGLNNILLGGLGNDTLEGGLGNDILTGGTGNDVFVFDTAPGAGNIDTITDFATGVDTIALSATLFPALGLDGEHVGLSANLTYSPVTGVLAYDSDGAGAGAAVTIAILGASSHPATLGTDFLLIA